MKLLIAEDNELNKRLSERLMRSRGIEFDMVSNGKEALDLAVRNHGGYDLCLMDVEMPVLNGIEATQAIREAVRYFPIAAFSASPHYRGPCLAAGMDDFIDKLCPPDKLLHKVRQLTVKALRVVFEGNDILLEEEMPMDQEHAREIRELAKKDLRKVKLFDDPGSAVIVHKNVTNKISHDFNVKKQLLSTFINRDPDKPTRCELYKESNYFMPQTYLTEEEYNAVIDAEDKELQAYSEPFLKGEE